MYSKCRKEERTEQERRMREERDEYRISGSSYDEKKYKHTNGKVVATNKYKRK